MVPAPQMWIFYWFLHCFAWKPNGRQKSFIWRCFLVILGNNNQMDQGWKKWLVSAVNKNGQRVEMTLYFHLQYITIGTNWTWLKWTLILGPAQLTGGDKLYSLLSPVCLILSETDGFAWQSPSQGHSQSEVCVCACVCGSVVTDLRTIKSSHVGGPVAPYMMTSVWYPGKTHTAQFPGCGPVQRYNDVSTVLLNETECGKCGRLVHILIF